MKKDEVFNTPFELGVRMAILLLALYPQRADLQRLMYLDYAVIYSADLGGPPSLHTPVPLRGVEYASRREVIEKGLYLMSIRSFVEVFATDAGILYGAGENAPSLIELIGTQYIRELSVRCEWAAAVLGGATDDELSTLLGVDGIAWDAHFVTNDQTSGVGA